jgi:hypothetical protein
VVRERGGREKATVAGWRAQVTMMAMMEQP